MFSTSSSSYPPEPPTADTLLPPTPPKDPVFSKSIIQDFISSLGHPFTAPPSSPTVWPLDPQIRATFHRWDLPQTHLNALLKLIPISCAYGEQTFSHLPEAARVYVIIYVILTIYIDDVSGSDSGSDGSSLPELSEFAGRFTSGRESGHPVLARFARHLCVETPKHYGPYGTSCIIKASLDFVIGCTLEAMFPHGFPPSRSKRFPLFTRTKTGIGEAFAHFLFPEQLFPEKLWLGRYITAIPEVADMNCLVNDVLSFYKESVVGEEENTFILMYAETFSFSAVEALRKMCEEAVTAHVDAREILRAGGGGLLAAYEGYVKGYVVWHCTQQRYRLGELMG